jgi:hypothetical protein
MSAQTNDKLLTKSLNMKKNDGFTYGQLEQMKEDAQMLIDTTSSQTIAKPHVSGSAVEPKVVNNGNVFGTGNWFTFYCGKCGSQLPSKVEKCVGSNPFDKGCGTAIKWS